jgi:hypothetical protein
MEKKRLYPSSQLVCALDARVLKLMMWILGWQNQGSIKYYPRQFAKACKMTEDEVERCIQTLVDCKLIDVSRVDQTWMITPNAEQFQKYYDIPISKVIEGNGIPMATEVKWNESVNKTQDVQIGDMSEQQLQTMILRLQAQLAEKKEVAKSIKMMEAPAASEYNDLPF